MDTTVAPYEVVSRSDGKWEILNNTTRPSHTVGATSWFNKSDAEFIAGHMTVAFQAGALAAQKVFGATEAEKRDIRKAAIESASRIDIGANASIGSYVEAAKSFEKYILG